MAAKQKKAPGGNHTVPHKPKARDRTQANTWLWAILYGMLGACGFYFLHPILHFNPSASSGYIAGMTMFSGVMAFTGATSFFQQNHIRIAYWTIPLVILQVFVNIMLAYGWVGQEPLWLMLANAPTLPLGIIWFFILRYASGDDRPAGSAGVFSIREVYSNPITKVAALALFLIAGVLFFYRLGYYDIWEDENLVINAAKGVYERGFSYLREGYDRAWIHTVLCAGVFELFGVSEFTGRIPSAIFGLVFFAVSFYVFARWYGLAWLALLIPIVCLMNDRFLILFRYMRMYALLIPLFLAGVYLINKAITFYQGQAPVDPLASSTKRKQIGYTLIALLFLPLLAHIHKLSMVLLPAFAFLIVYQVLVFRTKNQMRMLYVLASAGVVLLLLTFVMEVDALKMFRQVAKRLFTSHPPMTAYFEYMFENGLPRNSTIMFLFAGLGLLLSGVSQRLKSLLVLNYLLIVIALVSMVYLIEGEGRDYRYIAHIIPFVVCNLLLATYYAGRVFGKKTYPWLLIAVFFLSTLQFVQDYKRVYVKHPWAPSYSVVYATLREQYKPGDALFARNIKTYYLDPVALAGEHYHKISKKSEYTLAQFRSEMQIEGRGWVMWELHKSHHWSRDILEYIYKNFKPVHSNNLDDLGVALFYYDETMISQD